jgi:hypothetical protein
VNNCFRIVFVGHNEDFRSFVHVVIDVSFPSFVLIFVGSMSELSIVNLNYEMDTFNVVSIKRHVLLLPRSIDKLDICLCLAHSHLYLTTSHTYRRYTALIDSLSVQQIN